jgi:hypothetical protein
VTAAAHGRDEEAVIEIARDGAEPQEDREGDPEQFRHVVDAHDRNRSGHGGPRQAAGGGNEVIPAPRPVPEDDIERDQGAGDQNGARRGRSDFRAVDDDGAHQQHHSGALLFPSRGRRDLHCSEAARVVLGQRDVRDVDADDGRDENRRERGDHTQRPEAAKPLAVAAGPEHQDQDGVQYHCSESLQLTESRRNQPDASWIQRFRGSRLSHSHTQSLSQTGMPCKP